MEKHNLFIDIETRSSEPLARAGVYRYAESADFRILLLSYALDGNPVVTLELSESQTLPEEFRELFDREDVSLVAHNCAFERICLSRFLGLETGHYLPPERWLDTMLMAQYLALPCSLAEAGKAIGISREKLTDGRALVRFFCEPDADGGFRRPEDFPEKWRRFREYNAVDVEAEREIFKKLLPFMPPETVRDEFHRSERINDAGVALDLGLVRGALRCNELTVGKAMERMRELTGLENPNSPVQLRHWLAERGVETDSVGRLAVTQMLGFAPDDVCEVLRLRQMTAKSSLAKYSAMLESVSEDGRVRGNFRFYGASRTGRFTGTRVALQCLPRNGMPGLEEARELAKAGDAETLEERFGAVQPVLSELIRTAFIPEKGKKFIVADFSAIEARAISGLSGEKWRLNAFSAGRDIYSETASRMFGIPVEKHGVNAEYRAVGKVAELALGYSGSRNALLRMGADRLNLSDAELDKIVKKWRAANPEIVSLWRDMEATAMAAIRFRGRVFFRNLEFSYEKGILFLKLPSGRCLAYPKARIAEADDGRAIIAFAAVAKGSGFYPETTFGGKLTENLTQSCARDILCCAMENVERALGGRGRIVMHVHDEIIVECDESVTLDEVTAAMCIPPPWAEDLPLSADGFETYYYRKD